MGIRLARRAGLAGLVGLLATLPLAPGAGPPALRPWRRVLTAEEVRAVEVLQRRGVRCWQAGEFAEALEAARAVAGLREEGQGADHWEAVTAR
jgi:hypothetical protein